MKSKMIAMMITGILVSSLRAEYRTWTNNDGSTAQLNLIGKSGEGDDMKAKFQLRNGRIVNLPVSILSEDDIKRVKEWTAPKATTVSEAASVFDELLEDQLVKLEGNKLKKYELEQKPTKYYMFYYTASWCGPCKRFTPSLVKFYDEKKAKSDEFEVVLISSDSDKGAMEKYANSAKMNWPQLELSKVKSFRQKFQHPGGGIPNLVLTDLQGKIIKSSYEGKKYIGPSAVLMHLESLLK